MKSEGLADVIKIFENDSIKLCLEKCLAEGYFPANAETVRELIDKKLIPFNQNYSTSTAVVNNIIRDATLDELKNIEGLYEKEGCLRLIDYRHTDGCIDVYTALQIPVLGRFVGIASEEVRIKVLVNSALTDLSKHIPEDKLEDFNNDEVLRGHLHQYFK